jgi:dTDP-glucose pyrophosphorylase
VSRTTRAVVLARGLGRRMRESAGAPPLPLSQEAAAAQGLKGMIPVAGRPFLDHVLHSLADAGIDEVALVIGPEHDEVRDYYRQLPTRRVSISFVIQPEPLGTADAVAHAEPWTRDGSFLTLNADNLYPPEVLQHLVDGVTPALPGFERDSLELPLDRIGTFALVERDARGHLARIVEKPGEDVMTHAGPSALISMNVWRFDARIFAAARDVPVSARGERELPQAVGLAASRGVPFEVFPVRGKVVDLSRRSDIAEVSRALAHAQVDV